MLKNYLKIAFRNLIKQKLFSFINISGLAVGITCSILIILFVNYEKSYDQFNIKADRTYRVAVSALIGNTKINQTYSSAITFQKLLQDFPEIETGVKFIKSNDKMPVYIKNKIFYESNIFAVDSTFYDVFTVPLIYGNSKTALIEPNSVVLSKNIALKYFGKTDVIGKIVTLELEDSRGPVDFKISGVSENMPSNSHFHYSMLISLTSFPELLNNQGWTQNSFISYIVLKKGVSRDQFEAKLKDFTRKYMGGKQFDEWVAKGNYWKYYLQPVTEIHLNSDLNGEFEPNGSSTYVNIFSLISIFILLIACINFMNLSTARSSLRAKEVGLRKVVGSGKYKLMFQFLFESIILSFLALGIALIMVEVLLPYYSNFISRPVSMSYFGNTHAIILLLLFGFLVGIISGSYPAFVLSSFKPITVLKNNAVQKSKHFNFRNILVVVQFAISIFLIGGTIIIYRQIQYLQNKNLGFDKEQVLVIKNPGTIEKNIRTFKQVLHNNNNIVDVSGSGSLPGTPFSNIGFGAEGVDNAFTLNLCVCDYDFQKTLKLEMLKGRFFSKEFPSDSSAVILNQKAAELLGSDDPIGKKINNWSQNKGVFHIIGIVKDFNYESLHKQIRPMALFYIGGYYKQTESYISIRIKTGNLPNTIKFVDIKWNEFSHGAPFEYSFLNDDFNNLYKNEMQTEKLFLVFSLLAIFIACLGLLGLASYIAELRTKEIGIKKVLGASVGRIVFSMSREFVKWVILANMVAWPAAYYFMNNWLHDFAYRINISLWVLVLSGGIALMIALATVSFQAIKAATANPVKSLKYE